MICCYVLLSVIIFYSLCIVEGVAKFEITSISSNSIVVRMISAANVSRFEMAVTIFDLELLQVFRRTEMSSSRTDDHQLFAFDGLTPNTWFCVRFNYRLFYKTRDGLSDISTKQELIARTKTNNSQLAHSIIDDQIIFIRDAVSDAHSVNVTVGTVFSERPKMSTLVVPELKCDRTNIKPQAKAIVKTDVIHFDLKQTFLSANTAHAKQMSEFKCSKLCIFPFLRANITAIGRETFRGKEWCGTLQEASAIISKNANTSTSNVIFLLFNLLLFIFLLFPVNQ